MKAEQNNPSTWAYGIRERGWYCAMWGVSTSYAEHLRSLGYEVRIQVDKPTELPAA